LTLPVPNSENPEPEEPERLILSPQQLLQRAALGLENPSAVAARNRQATATGPVVIEVTDLDKSFHIPEKTGRRLPFRPGGRELRALRGVSFEVRRGEFFGIVGRNGSGKSTLLKILASIYRADAGRVRVAGRLAPFIELGVGFNPEFTARENVALNGVMMGLSRRESSARLDRVLDFAGLTEFVDLRLKNYSSGMMVRLAFAVMVEADADIMLVDEVIAVGDASFAQKCMDVFRERRRSGKTVVLVTHDMGTVQHFCDRAMLIHDGDMRYLGDPEEAALAYFRLNFAGRDSDSDGVVIRLVDVWLEDPSGVRVEDAHEHEPIGFHIVFEAEAEIVDPLFGFQLLNVDEVPIFGFGESLSSEAAETSRVRRGERVHLSATVENRLVPGRYTMTATVARNATPGDNVMKEVQVLDFLVRGTDPNPGMVSVGERFEAVVE
jgi:ABC-type polysaccharide/polyol phosphate transport system ATPase subunit